MLLLVGCAIKVLKEDLITSFSCVGSDGSDEADDHGADDHDDHGADSAHRVVRRALVAAAEYSACEHAEFPKSHAYFLANSLGVTTLLFVLMRHAVPRRGDEEKERTLSLARSLSLSLSLSRMCDHS